MLCLSRLIVTLSCNPNILLNYETCGDVAGAHDPPLPLSVLAMIGRECPCQQNRHPPLALHGAFIWLHID